MQSGKLPLPMKRLLESSTTPVEIERKGRVLRVKCGYNPNSSSYGSIVFVMPAALLAATGIFGAVAGLIGSTFVRYPMAPPDGEGLRDAPSHGETGAPEPSRIENPGS